MFAQIDQPVQEVTRREFDDAADARPRGLQPRPWPTQELVVGVRGVHRKESDRKAGFEAGNGGCGFQQLLPGQQTCFHGEGAGGVLDDDLINLRISETGFLEHGEKLSEHHLKVAEGSAVRFVRRIPTGVVGNEHPIEVIQIPHDDAEFQVSIERLRSQAVEG